MYKKLTIFSFIFFVIDQLSKILIINNVALNKSINIIPNFFSLTYVRNEGAAFSLLDGAVWFFIIIAFIFLYLIKDKNLSKFEIITYSLLIGGILGNLIDRIIYGYVIDFLSFIIFGYNFAIFNFADTFIVISVVLLIILTFKEKKCKNI